MPSNKASASAPQLSVELQPLQTLKVNPANAREHPPHQIEALKASIRQFGFVAPILLGSERTVIAGHGRHAAACALGMTEVPCIDLSHLPVEQQRTYTIADNQLAQKSTWNMKALALEIRALDALDLDFSLEVTGFTAPELDELQFPTERQAKPEQVAAPSSCAVTCADDLWELDGHKLLCGDATDAANYATLMGGETARMAFADPPFNVPVERHVRRRRGEHREFAQAAGELTPEDFQGFLHSLLMLMGGVCVPGAIMFCAMDWRSLAELFAAGREAGLELKNLICWAKTNSGLGGFYRSQHEHIAVFKTPGAKNINTFGMGRSGRHRSNVGHTPAYLASAPRARASSLPILPPSPPPWSPTPSRTSAAGATSCWTPSPARAPR